MDFKLNTRISQLLMLLAFLIVTVTLWYTNSLANQLKIEEQKKVALWAKATKELSDINNSNYDLGFVFEVVNNNTTVPVIQVNSEGDIIAHRNINNKKSTVDLKKEIELMKRGYPPIEIELIDGSKELIYYKDSRLLKNLRYFPVFILSIISAFILIAYFAFSNARIAQQNKVWTGMAKETAHQIGTPLSSLLGWLEYLKDQKLATEITKEIEKDISRLSIIAARFSKIGSLPKLEALDIVPVLKNSINYMNKRASSKISFQLQLTTKELTAMVNKDLFEWVVENIIKNSIDAIDQRGRITIKPYQIEKKIVIDFIDNGRGVKKSLFKEIFEPGFTSKKRGWGLGLSLVSRIIKDYHKGEVRLVSSSAYKETKIRVVLNK